MRRPVRGCAAACGHVPGGPCMRPLLSGRGRWRAAVRSRAAAQIGAPHRRVVLQLRGGAFADDAAVLQQVAAVGDGQARPRVLLHQQHADAQLLDARQRLEQLAADQRRETRATARPAAGCRAPTSARGRWPPSAARRRSWCGRTGPCARRAAGTGSAPASGSPPRARARAAERRRAAGCRAPTGRGRCRGPPAPAPAPPRPPRAAAGPRVGPAERDARARQVRDHPAQRLQARRLAGAVGAQHDDDLAAADA